MKIFQQHDLKDIYFFNFIIIIIFFIYRHKVKYDDMNIKKMLNIQTIYG